MKQILLGAAFAACLMGCDSGGCITRHEAAQAFSQRDRAIEVMGRAIQQLQDGLLVPDPLPEPKVSTKKGKGKKK